MAQVAERPDGAASAEPAVAPAQQQALEALAQAEGLRVQVTGPAGAALRFGPADGDPVTVSIGDHGASFWQARAHENALLLAGALGAGGARSAVTRGLGLLSAIEPPAQPGQPGRWEALARVDLRASSEAMRLLPARLCARDRAHQIRLSAFILTQQPPACRELELRLILRATARGRIPQPALATLASHLMRAAGPALPQADARRLHRTLQPMTTGQPQAEAQIDARHALLDLLTVIDARHSLLASTRAMRRHACHQPDAEN